MNAYEWITFIDKQRGSKLWSEDTILLAQALDGYVDLKLKENGLAICRSCRKIHHELLSCPGTWSADIKERCDQCDKPVFHKVAHEDESGKTIVTRKFCQNHWEEYGK